MEDKSRRKRTVATEQTRDPNISIENQPVGAARRPSDTLDREPAPDPAIGGAISSDYNSEAMTRRDEERDSGAGRDQTDGKSP